MRLGGDGLVPVQVAAGAPFDLKTGDLEGEPAGQVLPQKGRTTPGFRGVARFDFPAVGGHLRRPDCLQPSLRARRLLGVGLGLEPLFQPNADGYRDSDGSTDPHDEQSEDR